MVFCWLLLQLRKISLFHLVRSHPSPFFCGLKWALKQVKQRSLRQGSASSGDTCRETARNTSFWFLFLCSYSLLCEYLHHRLTASCCSLLFLYFPWTSVVTICKDPLQSIELCHSYLGKDCDCIMFFHFDILPSLCTSMSIWHNDSTKLL